MKNQTRIQTAFISILLAGFLLFSGCKKGTNSNANLTADDAADAVTCATSSSTGGLAAEISTAAAYSTAQGVYKTSSGNSTMNLTCGVAFDTAVSYNYTGSISASYNSQWSYLMSCTGPIPQSLSLTGSYTGNFATPRLQSNNSGSRTWVLTGLDLLTTTPYVFNGSFSRTGSHTSLVRNRYTYTVNMNISVTNLTVSKTTYQITGGTGTVAVTGQVSNGNNYTFNGDIVFNGNNTATLTINGSTYTINL